MTFWPTLSSFLLRTFMLHDKSLVAGLDALTPIDSALSLPHCQPHSIMCLHIIYIYTCTRIHTNEHTCMTLALKHDGLSEKQAKQ